MARKKRTTSRTIVKRICERCKREVYRYRKDEGMSDVLKGAHIGLHLLECDPNRFNEILHNEFRVIE